MPFEPVNPDTVFQTKGHPSSTATLTTGKLLHISGQVSRGIDGHSVGLADISAQAHQVFKNMSAVVEAAGGTLGDVCRMTIFVTDRKYLPSISDARRHYFTPPFPAATAVVVQGLANPDWLVEIEATACL